MLKLNLIRRWKNKRFLIILCPNKKIMNILEIEEENDSKVYIFGEVSYPASDSVEEAMPYELIRDSIISPQD